MASSANPTRDDFAALLSESLGNAESLDGRVVKGTVTAIENDMAVIDVGLKSEGRVALREFAAPGQKADLKIGDEVERALGDGDVVQQPTNEVVDTHPSRVEIPEEGLGCFTCGLCLFSEREHDGEQFGGFFETA